MPLTRKKSKAWFSQIVFILLLLLLFGWFANNVASQLAARGIGSGFDFLSHQAGFGIAFHLLPFSESSSLWQVFLVGAVNTLFISFAGIVLATVLGLVVALLRLSPIRALRVIGTTYVETLRNIPLLLQFFVWYFAVLRQLPMPRESWRLGDSLILNIRGLYLPFPEQGWSVWVVLGALALGMGIGHWGRVIAFRHRALRGRMPGWWWLPFALPLLLPLLAILGLSTQVNFTRPYLDGLNFSGGAQIIPELIAAVLSLGLYTAAFIAEIIRGALQAVAKGQKEAAAALGLNGMQTLGFVTLPQALDHIIPPLISQYLNLLKNSSLAAAIAFPELVLVFAGTSLNVSGQAVEIMVMTLAFYLILSLSISAIINAYQIRRKRFANR